MTSLRALCDGEYAAEAEAAAMQAEADAATLTALYDALGFVHGALGAALGLTGGCPSSLLLSASLNGSLAFPLRSPQSEALGVLLGAVSVMVNGARS